MSARANAIDEARERVFPLSLRIAPVYQLLGWKWTDAAEPPGAHAISELFYELLNDMAEDEEAISTATGGLRVEYDVDAGWVYLRFEING